jgi:imidazolonepropionase
MRFVWSLACLKMDMTPTEALHALTLNGAAAMEMSDHFGSITIGKQADLILTKPMERLASIPYRFTEDPIKHVFVGGSVVDF